ncbi:DALR anticodon binding domain-containing protein [Microdochium nivale]|nr:DALR anticodon binding domain-containing protein [Microdochium nivale]
MEVLRLMTQYPEVTLAAYNSHEPSLIMTYLLRLADEVEYFYDKGNDKDVEEEDGDGEESGGLSEQDEAAAAAEPDEPEPPEATLVKAVLFKQVRQILTNGMRLPGITPVVS